VFLVPIVKVVMLGKGLESECEEEKGICVEEHRQGGWGRSTRYCAENRLKVKRNVSPEMLSGALGFAGTGCPRRLIGLARGGGPDFSSCRTHGKHVMARVAC
jgi:hypothetical protein